MVFVARRDRRQGVASHVHAAHREELEYRREVQPVPGPVVDETENAKNAEPDPSAGPAPNRHLLGSRTRPAIPPRGRLRRHDPCPGPVGTGKQTGGVYGYLPVCKRTVTCQPPCGGAVGPLGDAVSGWACRSWDDAGPGTQRTNDSEHRGSAYRKRLHGGSPPCPRIFVEQCTWPG